MPNRAATTILLLTRHTIVRADFSRGARPALLEHWSQPRPDVTDLPTLVEVALGLGPKPGKQVWVLTTDVWTQTISLGATRALNAGMSDDELAAALNFEAESLSGLSAFEATAGFRTLPGGGGHWVTQIRSADVAQIDETLRRAGSRLAGIGHPGGLPTPLAPGATPNLVWQRVELWPDAVVGVHGGAQSSVQVQVINSDPAMERWRTESEMWRQSMGPAQRQETLVAPGLPAPASQRGDVLRLDDEVTLTAWLTACATSLQHSTPPMPVVKPARRPMTVGARSAVALTLAVCAMALCIATSYYMSQSTQSLQAKLSAAKRPGEQLETLRKDAKAHEAKLGELKKQQAKIDQSLQTIVRQRQRLAHLLDQLSRDVSEDLVIESIEQDFGEPRLHGLCLRPELADQLAARLGEALVDDGWEVQSAKKHARNVGTEGGPWAFEIRFRTTGTVGLASPGASKGLPRRVRD